MSQTTHPSTKPVAGSPTNIIWWLSGLALVMFTAVKWNPLERFMEAGAASYYQARVAYERGSADQKARILAAFSDGKITLQEYSDVVFPLFVKVARDGEPVMPDSEMKKSVEQERYELKQSIQKKS